jgi:hypothetical protein
MKLELYYPIKPWIVTQKFGETAYLSFYKENKVILSGHNGIDLAAIHGQPIYAAHDGWAYYEIDAGQGHGVVLRTDKEFEYEDRNVFFKTIYWHMCNPDKEPKYASPVRNATLNNPIYVKRGDIIGYVNSTGLSTGDHLHFGIKPVAKTGEPNNTWYNFEQNNGMYGAIDPTPYLNGKHANGDSNFFDRDLLLGESHPDIKRLQKFLKDMGHFPQQTACTEYYGPITRSAVYDFQLRFVPLSWYEKYVMKGNKFGQKTRAVINTM